MWNPFRRKPKVGVPLPPQGPAAPAPTPEALRPAARPPSPPVSSPVAAGNAVLSAALAPLAGKGANPQLETLCQMCEFWLQRNALAQETLLKVLAGVASKPNPAFLGHLLVDAKCLTEDKLLYSLSRMFRIPCYNLTQYDINAAALSTVSGALARQHQVFPVDRLGKILTLVVTHPFTDLKALGIPKDLSVRRALCSRDVLQRHLEIYYPAEPVRAAPRVPSPVRVPRPAPPRAPSVQPVPASPRPVASPPRRPTAAAAGIGRLDSIFSYWSLTGKDAAEIPALHLPAEEVDFYLRRSA